MRDRHRSLIFAKLPVPNGLALTFEILTATVNDAAIEVLVSGLDSRDRGVRDGCVAGLLRRRNAAGHREILCRLHETGEQWRALIDEFGARLVTALRHAVVGRDDQLCENACRAILWSNNYDLIPALITRAEDASHNNSDRAAATVLQLVEELGRQLAARRTQPGGRDLDRLRLNVESTLERSVLRFPEHERAELIKAFLLVADRENPTLRKILEDPLHAVHRAVVQWLIAGEERPIIDLLISFLGDATPPRAAIQLVGKRADATFITRLIHKVDEALTPALERGLKQLDHIAWLQEGCQSLSALDDDGQAAAIELSMISGISAADKFGVLERVLQGGTVGGRRAACEAMEEFNGDRANRLIVQALEDSDPRVQASAARQLRRRAIPGAVTRLIQLIDSPSSVVRDAAQDSLTEFNFERYVANYDLLGEAMQRSSGALVVKIDPTAIDRLVRELAAPARSRRIRGVAMAESMGVVADVGYRLLQLLQDEDHFVRKEAARVLHQYDTPATRKALKQLALGDRSVAVQQAATESLQTMLTRTSVSAATTTKD